MPPHGRLSHPALKVLRVFLTAFSDNVRSEIAGADIMKSAGISSGTLYPILLRLERAGVLASRWEKDTPQDLGRPRRRLYRITSAGAAIAHEALDDLASPSPLAPNEA